MRTRTATPLLAACVAVALLPTATPATAAPTTTSPQPPVSRGYSLSKQWNIPGMGCLTARATGTLKAMRSWDATIGGTMTFKKYDPKLQNPAVAVSLRQVCVGPVSSQPQLSKLSVRQSWYYSKCSVNPSISVSAPFGVSVSGTPTCGQEKVATRSTTYPRGSRWNQLNDGTVATFKRSAVGYTDYPKVCAHAIVTLTAYKGTTSHARVLDMGTACV